VTVSGLSRLAALVTIAFVAFEARQVDAAVTIHVFAAASLTDALKEIATSYESKSGDRILFNFGASSILARQIEEGAPADIFFSADEAKMDALEKKGLVVTGTRKSRLSNSLVIVVATDRHLQIRDPQDLLQPAIKHLALADPQAVPAGIYAKAYLRQIKLWDQIQARVVPTDNVRAALSAVESEDAEAGIVYRTDAGISKRVRIVFTIPAKDGPSISYPMAVLKESSQPTAAKRLLDYLDSEEAAKVFRRFDFNILGSASQP
jgi:molybdate transport system substrate-binding protein